MSKKSVVYNFFTLEPHTILDALQHAGFLSTGRYLQLNSLENRVYEIELESFEEYGRFVVTKFYRPGRWTVEQIQAEHEFLFELEDGDLPVVSPLSINGSSLFTCPKTGIFFAVFPKFGGRNLDEFSVEQGKALGRILARIHMIGSRHAAPERTTLTAQHLGKETLVYLTENQAIPADIESVFIQTVESVLELSKPLWSDIQLQRIHADAHVGNILNRDGIFYFVDFDDMANGPAVQDLWLLSPGRDAYARGLLEHLLEGYTELRTFNRRELFLIEPLRSLRVLYFSAWIHRRWEDPSFQRTFVDFNTPGYWREQLGFFCEQREVLQEIIANGEPLLVFQ